MLQHAAGGSLCWADFQQAPADLTASPELCIRERIDPDVLREKYRLTEREWVRLVGIVQHRGMAARTLSIGPTGSHRSPSVFRVKGSSA